MRKPNRHPHRKISVSVPDDLWDIATQRYPEAGASHIVQHALAYMMSNGESDDPNKAVDIAWDRYTHLAQLGEEAKL